MTFEEFQNTRRLSFDLRDESCCGDYYVDHDKPVMGFIYDESFYIEIRRDGYGDLTIENQQYESLNTEELEKILYEYSLVA